MDGHILRTELCCMNGHRVKWATVLTSKCNQLYLFSIDNSKVKHNSDLLV